ncbi:MAG: SPOR domain-containing protein [Pseudomonadota bacterium]|nr:SPOR domain-containing protein [Pseudomonadota bacterium]
MPRDYAQRGGNNRQQARGRSSGKRKGGGGLPNWVWLFAGLSVGLAVAAFVYISRPMNGNAVPVFEGTDAGEAVATGEEPVATSKPRQGGKNTAIDKKGAPIALPPKEKARFTFYEILRDQEVVIPQEAVKGDKPPPAVVAAGDGSFVIQVASFRAQTEADRQRASLALIGIESRIESITIDGKDTYYRVRIGPESNWKKVQATMARLEENDISAMLIKLK